MIDFLASAMQEDAGFVRRLGCLDQLVARAVQLRSQVVVLEFKVQLLDVLRAAPLGVQELH